MNDVIITAVLSLVGTLVGTFGGIVTGSKLTNFRVERLEKSVEKHNNMIERMFKLEGRVTEVEHNVKNIENKL